MLKLAYILPLMVEKEIPRGKSTTLKGRGYMDWYTTYVYFVIARSASDVAISVVGGNAEIATLRSQ